MSAGNDKGAASAAPAPADLDADGWRPWLDMPVGDQRFIVREVMSEDGQTALAYWTGRFMASAPISDEAKPLPFKVWRQRPATQLDGNDVTPPPQTRAVGP